MGSGRPLIFDAFGVEIGQFLRGACGGLGLYSICTTSATQSLVERELCPGLRVAPKLLGAGLSLCFPGVFPGLALRSGLVRWFGLNNGAPGRRLRSFGLG